MRRADPRSSLSSPSRKGVQLRLLRVSRWWLGLFFLLTLAVAALALSQAERQSRAVTAEARPRASQISGHTVVIDAGHGGVDPGAVGRDGLKEKQVTLPIARQLERLLNRAAVYTIMVRRTDEDLADPGLRGLSKRKRQDIQRRVQLANAQDADLYVSIHANSFPGGPWKGAQTFYSADDPGGKELARAIQASLVERLGPNKRRAKTGDFAVLNKTEMPAAIVEVGFLSHPEEARQLSDPQYQTELAEAIYDGMIHYWLSADAPDRVVPEEPTAATRGAFSTTSGGPGRAWLFPVGTGEDGAPVLVPVNRPILGVRRDAGPEMVATAALEALLRLSGSADDQLIGSPFPEGARLVALRVDDEGTAFVDLIPEPGDAKWGGVTSEALAVYAIVNTLTAIRGIDRVVLSAGGELMNTLGGHVFFNHPLEWNAKWVVQDAARR